MFSTWKVSFLVSVPIQHQFDRFYNPEGQGLIIIAEQGNPHVHLWSLYHVDLLL